MMRTQRIRKVEKVEGTPYVKGWIDSARYWVIEGIHTPRIGYTSPEPITPTIRLEGDPHRFTLGRKPRTHINTSDTANPTVINRIKRAVTQSRKTGDWMELENIIPTTAHTNRNRERLGHTHTLRLRAPQFRITGVGNNRDKTVIVIGAQKQITRTINPNPTPYTQPLGITIDTQGVTHYTPLEGLNYTAWTGTKLTPEGNIKHPTPKPNPTKPNPLQTPTGSQTVASAYGNHRARKWGRFA